MRDYDEPPRKCHACGGTGGTWLSVCDNCYGDGIERWRPAGQRDTSDVGREDRDPITWLKVLRAQARRWPADARMQMQYGSVRQQAVSPVMLP
ncbi:MAG: hypothetical protein JSS52_00720 [Proteobacteria bacterium]|nr:hypothetical protein [Pseudomonadota bacterium]